MRETLIEGVEQDLELSTKSGRVANTKRVAHRFFLSPHAFFLLF